jgi:hypothetical protein
MVLRISKLNYKYAQMVTRRSLSPIAVNNDISRNRNPNALNESQTQNEMRLKIFPVSNEDCYRACSDKRGDHDSKENTI